MYNERGVAFIFNKMLSNLDTFLELGDSFEFKVSAEELEAIRKKKRSRR
jgi:hypothetical protein